MPSSHEKAEKLPYSAENIGWNLFNSLCKNSISIFSHAKSNNTGWKVINLPTSSLKY